MVMKIFTNNCYKYFFQLSVFERKCFCSRNEIQIFIWDQTRTKKKQLYIIKTAVSYDHQIDKMC